MDNDTTEDLLRNHTVFAQQMEERYDDIERRLTAEERVIAQLKEDNRQQRITIETFRKSTAEIDSEIAEIHVKYLELTAKHKRRVRSTVDEADGADEADSMSTDGSMEVAAQSVDLKTNAPETDKAAIGDGMKCIETNRVQLSEHSEAKQSQSKPSEICPTKDTDEFHHTHHASSEQAEHAEHTEDIDQTEHTEQSSAQTEQIAISSMAIQRSAIPENPSEVNKTADVGLNAPCAVQPASAKEISHQNNETGESSKEPTDVVVRKSPVQRKKRAQIVLDRIDAEVNRRPKRKAAPVYLKEPSIRNKLYRR